MNKIKSSPWFILLIMVAGVLAGGFLGKDFEPLGISFYGICDVGSQLFLNSLTLIVVPIVSSSIIVCMAKLAKTDSFKRLGIKTILSYLVTCGIAALIGLLIVLIFEPGKSPELQKMVSTVSVKALDSSAIKQIIISIIPSNLLGVLDETKLLGLIFFSILLGFAISKAKADLLLNFFDEIFKTIIQITHFIIKFLPLGVFFLVAKIFAQTGFGSLKQLGLFLATTVIALSIHALIVLPIFLRTVSKVSPLKVFKALWPALMLSFSTSSSAAALPVTIECVEKNVGISNKIASLVLPLGVTLNKAASALFGCIAVIFVAQVYGVELSFLTLSAVFILSWITAMGIAGIPSACLVAVIMILKTIGIPTEGIGLFIAVDRILDMLRSAINTLNNSCCTIFVATSEGEKPFSNSGKILDA